MSGKAGVLFFVILMLPACGGGGGGGGDSGGNTGGNDTGGNAGYQVTTNPDISCPATPPTEQDLQEYFASMLETVLRADCGECHVAGGEAAATQHIYTSDSQQNFEMFRALAGQFVVDLNIPLPAAKSSLQIPHEGGRQITTSSQLYMNIVEFGTMVAQFNNCETASAASTAMKQAASALACEMVAEEFLGAVPPDAYAPRSLRAADKRTWSAAFTEAGSGSAASRAGVTASIAAWLDRGNGADPDTVAFFAKRYEQHLADERHSTEVMTCPGNPYLEVVDAKRVFDPAVYRAWRDVIAEMLLAGDRVRQ